MRGGGPVLPGRVDPQGPRLAARESPFSAAICRCGRCGGHGPHYCVICAAAFPYRGGRPRRFCDDHQQAPGTAGRANYNERRRAHRVRADYGLASCRHCGQEFTRRWSFQRRCSSCARTDRKPSAHSRGYGNAWKRRRAEVLLEEPTCRVCGAPATEVDHIHARVLGGTDDRHNLRAICSDCHARKSRRDRALALVAREAAS